MFERNYYMQQSRAFTLLELITVVVIIGILAIAAMPTFMRSVERSRQAEGVNLASACAQANERFRIQNGAYTAVLANLDIEFPNAPRFFGNPAPAAGGGCTITRNAVASARWGLYTITVSAAGVASCAGGTECPGGL